MGKETGKEADWDKKRESFMKQYGPVTHANQAPVDDRAEDDNFKVIDYQSTHHQDFMPSSSMNTKQRLGETSDNTKFKNEDRMTQKQQKTANDKKEDTHKQSLKREDEFKSHANIEDAFESKRFERQSDLSYKKEKQSDVSYKNEKQLDQNLTTKDSNITKDTTKLSSNDISRGNLNDRQSNTRLGDKQHEIAPREQKSELHDREAKKEISGSTNDLLSRDHMGESTEKTDLSSYQHATDPHLGVDISSMNPTIKFTEEFVPLDKQDVSKTTYHAPTYTGNVFSGGEMRDRQHAKEHFEKEKREMNATKNTLNDSEHQAQDKPDRQ